MSYIQSERPTNTSSTYASFKKTFRELCHELSLQPLPADPCTVATESDGSLSGQADERDCRS